MKIILSLFVLIVLNACAAREKPQITVVGIETIQDQALQEIQSTPTKFFVNGPDNGPYWERAKLFFLQYLKAPNIEAVEERPTASRVILSSRSLPKQKYLYQIGRQPYNGGYNYVIVVSPKTSGSSKAMAERNAKNLARFIREGTLEISLLD